MTMSDDNGQPSELAPGASNEEKRGSEEARKQGSEESDLEGLEESTGKVLQEASDDDLDLEILRELREDDGPTDPLTLLLAIVQAAYSDGEFGAGTVKYLCETMGRPEIWAEAGELAELGEDEDQDDQEPDDEV